MIYTLLAVCILLLIFALIAIFNLERNNASLKEDLSNVHDKLDSINKELEYFNELLNKIEAVTEDIQHDEAKKNINEKILYDVALWGAEINGFTASSIARHFDLSLYQAKVIADVLYDLCICGPYESDSKPRKMQMTVEEIKKLNERKYFDVKL